MSYTRYLLDHAPAPSGNSGWDAWARDYAQLAATSPAYALGKDLLHEHVRRLAPAGDTRRVLDFNCGAGDDLQRFLDAGWHATGCDGSPGMLAMAAGRCRPALTAGRLELWHGRAEELEPGSFGGARFDLVFSTLGGFAYLDDAQFVRVHRVLGALLRRNGILMLAHLTPFCPAESLYHFAHLHPRRAVQRWSGSVEVSVRGQPLRMRLRSPRRIRRLLAGVVEIERLLPLLWCTPPFQSGYQPGPRMLRILGAIERRTASLGALAGIADQVVCVARPASSPSNTSR